MKAIISSISASVAILIAAFFVIQFQSGRIDALKNKNAELERDKYNADLLAEALGDTIKNYATYHPLPAAIIINAPEPKPNNPDGPIKPEVGSSRGYSEIYCYFPTKTQWDNWYRSHCTGVIEINASRMMDSRRGVKVIGQKYYGIGTDSLDELQILPSGDWSERIRKEGFRGGITAMLSRHADFSATIDLTWRKWGPAARIDINHNRTSEIWGGLRRNF
jgi:hypothetical protein